MNKAFMELEQHAGKWIMTQFSFPLTKMLNVVPKEEGGHFPVNVHPHTREKEQPLRSH